MPFFFIRLTIRGEGCLAAASTSASVIIPLATCFFWTPGLQGTLGPQRGGGDVTPVHGDRSPEGPVRCGFVKIRPFALGTLDLGGGGRRG